MAAAARRAAHRRLAQPIPTSSLTPTAPTLRRPSRPLSTSGLHADCIVVDGLIVSKWGPEVFASMRAGGVTAANCTVSVWEGFQPTCDNIAAFKRWFREHADTIREVRSVADIHAAKAADRVGVILGFQNTTAFEENVGYVQLFKELGVGVAQMT